LNSFFSSGFSEFLNIITSEDHNINKETEKYALDWNDLVLRSLELDPHNPKLNRILDEYDNLIMENFNN